MKHIASAIAVFFASFALISCGSKEEEVSVTTHAEIADGVVAEMTNMMTGMSKITDAASAEAFAQTVPSLKEKMKGYLASAKSLTAPTEDDKAAFQEKMNAAQEKAGPAMMAMMMGMSQNPDAEAIGKIMENVMEDDEMQNVMDELEDIYAVEQSGEEPAAAE